MLFYQGIQNIIWNEAKEKKRIAQILEKGFKESAYVSGMKLILLGTLILLSSSIQPQSSYWNFFGIFLLMLSIITIAVVNYSSTKPLNDKKMPSDVILKKRVLHRKISGMLFIFSGIIWTINGMINV